jgi:hypothetical protein
MNRVQSNAFSFLLELLMVILVLELLFMLAISNYRLTLLKMLTVEVMGIQQTGRNEVQEY